MVSALHVIHSQVFQWKPKSKARPRMTKTGHTYTEKATVDAEAALAEQYAGPTFDGPIGVTIDFTDTTVEVTIEDRDDYASRKLRGDIDNYSKLILDALNKIAYVDDGQIVALHASKL